MGGSRLLLPAFFSFIDVRCSCLLFDYFFCTWHDRPPSTTGRLDYPLIRHGLDALSHPKILCNAQRQTTPCFKADRTRRTVSAALPCPAPSSSHGPQMHPSRMLGDTMGMSRQIRTQKLRVGHEEIDRKSVV